MQFFISPSTNCPTNLSHMSRSLLCLKHCARVECNCIHVALCSLRNANGLTAAQLALAQGFGECSQFLCSVQNHQLNGFYTNGIASGLYRDNLITDGLNGYTGTNRKRSYEESDRNGFKKPRTEGMHLHPFIHGITFHKRHVRSFLHLSCYLGNTTVIARKERGTNIIHLMITCTISYNSVYSSLT